MTNLLEQAINCNDGDRAPQEGALTYFKPKNMGDVRLRLGSIARI
jgi:hypothetical protein